MEQKISNRVHYERLQNGADIYMLKTASKDVVTCFLAFPGGVLATYNTQSIALLIEDMLPGGTKKKKRNTILEQFEMLGAHVSFQMDSGYTIVTLASRSEVFIDAFRLVFEVLTIPTFEESEFAEAVARLKNSLRHSLENTNTQALISLQHALYAKGHPHWSPSTKVLLKEIDTLTADAVARFYTETLTSVGAIVCIAGDIDTQKLLNPVRNSIQTLPSMVPKQAPVLHLDRVCLDSAEDVIVSLKDKLSVDTYAGLPVTITRDHSLFEAFKMGISILGSSSNSRIFSTLRTKMNLTYDARASLVGFNDGYPGHVSASAIFPNDLFRKGRVALKETLKHFFEKGVTRTELEERKEEVSGRYKVNLSTTSGMCSMLFATVRQGKPVTYIDEYVECVQALTLREVNTAVISHTPLDLMKTASAGSVDQQGAPL
jgi:zinc protease